MFDFENVPPVTSDEELIRYVLYSDHIKTEEKTRREYIHWKGFKPNKGAVSVTRRTNCTNEELMTLGRAVARATRKDQPNPEVYAYARSSVADCTDTNTGIEVKESKLKDNPNHADIIVADSGEDEQLNIRIDHFLMSKFAVMRELDNRN